MATAGVLLLGAYLWATGVWAGGDVVRRENGLPERHRTVQDAFLSLLALVGLAVLVNIV